MNTNPEALKALYVAAGGDASAVADAVTSVDVLNAIAVLFGGDGDATTNPDAIGNIAAVYTPGGGDEPVSQIDKYNSNKFAAYTDGFILVVGGVFPEVEAAATLSQGYINVKAQKGKTLTKVFDYIQDGFSMGVSTDAVTVTNSTAETGSPFLVGIYTIS